MLPSKIAKEFENAGQNVRKYYQRRLPSNPALDYYYIMRDTPNNQTIIVEYGFADSSEDDPNQIKNNYEELTEAVVKALADYSGVKYIPPMGSNTYVVKSGDTLWSIAKKFNTTANELKVINNLTSNALSINQVLKIPSNDLDITNTYTVKSGDTLYQIANKFGITVNELKSINNLSTNNLSVGQVLTINKNNSTDNNLENTYIVKSGDSLYKIANMFDTTVDNLKVINNLKTNNLSIGQILKIRDDNIKNDIYTVKSGDTLYTISKNLGITVDELKKYNNLNSNLLSVGQILRIPGNSEKIYTVKSGDTLYNIARANNVAVSDLIDLNNLSTTNLSIGQKLLLP